MGVHANPRADAYNSTRYLCVAAELDSNFAHAVIAEVLEEPFLAVAPSFGVDLVPVVCHALNARRRRNVRDVALTAIAAMNLLLNPFGMIATALTWLVTQVAYRRARLRWPQWGTGQAIAVAAIAGGAASVVFGIGLLLPQLILGAVSFAASGPAGGAGFALPLRLSVLFFPLSLLAVWGILRWERLATRSVLVDTLRAETFDPAARALRVEANPGEQERLWIVYQRQRPQNVTAYSGFFPFLGAGEHRDTWSVGIDLDRGAPAGPLENGLRDARKHPQPFSVSELQDHVTRRLEALRSPERPSTGRLEGLIVEDRLFVQGAEVWRDQRLLPDPASPPVSWVPQEVLEEIGNDPVGIVRHYKCARVESWGGEVVLSVFLHFAVEARTLYVEQTVCLLHPIDERYRVVDRMAPHMTPEEHRAVLWTTLTDIPAALLRAPVEWWRGWRSKRRERLEAGRLRQRLHQGWRIDYGARMSVRQLGAADRFRFWFQGLDARRNTAARRPTSSPATCSWEGTSATVRSRSDRGPMRTRAPEARPPRRPTRMHPQRRPRPTDDALVDAGKQFRNQIAKPMWSASAAASRAALSRWDRTHRPGSPQPPSPRCSGAAPTSSPIASASSSTPWRRRGNSSGRRPGPYGSRPRRSPRSWRDQRPASRRDRPVARALGARSIGHRRHHRRAGPDRRRPPTPVSAEHPPSPLLESDRAGEGSQRRPRRIFTQ
jgi:hypothetical protein